MLCEINHMALLRSFSANQNNSKFSGPIDEREKSDAFFPAQK